MCISPLDEKFLHRMTYFAFTKYCEMLSICKRRMQSFAPDLFSIRLADVFVHPQRLLDKTVHCSNLMMCLLASDGIPISFSSPQKFPEIVHTL
jgi:hypothetical protein